MREFICKHCERSLGVLITLICLIVAIFLVALPAVAEEVKKGGTMVAALGGDPPSINAGITTDIATINLCGQIYSTVIRLDNNGKVVPYLAKSWEMSPDGKTYTFRFFENIKWHDGKPFTSEDVAWSLLNVNREMNGNASSAYKMVEVIETPDKHTAVFKLEYPYPPLLKSLAYFSMATILPKHIFEGSDPRKNPHNLKPIGTGPFIFKEYKKGSHAILERNPNFHLKGRPYLDRLVFQIIPNQAARVLALKRGDVDFLPYYSIPLSEVPLLDKDPKISVAIAYRPIAGIWHAHLNNRKLPFSNVEVRRAMYYALDRQELMEKAGFGYGKISMGPISSLQPEFYTDKGRPYPYDPERAEKMLDAAGYPRKADGQRFKIRVSYMKKYGPMDSAAKLIRIQFLKVGIDVEIIPMDSGAWRDTVYKDGDFDVNLGTWATGPDPAIGTERHYVCRNTPQPNARNMSGYCDPELDKVFDAAARELDEKKRVSLYHTAVEMLTEAVPILWLWDRRYPIAFNANLMGLPADPTQYGPFDEVWWNK